MRGGGGSVQGAPAREQGAQTQHCRGDGGGANTHTHQQLCNNRQGDGGDLSLTPRL